jgi:D-sedoheptulose 7-phosphate isomerase
MAKDESSAHTAPQMACVRLTVQLDALFADSLRVISGTLEQAEVIRDMARIITKWVRNGNKVMVCGNGGSCADADHLVAELLVRFKRDREPIPAINLAMDTASFTACSNDYGYEEHYARMVRALGTPGDVLLVISTSGNSMNIIRAVNTAKAMGISTMGLLGLGGCVECDLSLHVPSTVTARIQEAHSVVIMTKNATLKQIVLRT